MYVTIPDDDALSLRLIRLEQGGWLAVLQDPSKGGTTTGMIFAEDYDSLTQKLKVHLVAEKLENS